MENNTNLTVFFDTVGRTILGEKVTQECNETDLVIKNPAVVHITPNQQTGQLSLQILPLFFKEFLADKSSPTIWIYKKALITESKDLIFDFKLQAQYQQIFSGTPATPKTEDTPSPDVVKLFDEE